MRSITMITAHKKQFVVQPNTHPYNMCCSAVSLSNQRTQETLSTARGTAEDYAVLEERQPIEIHHPPKILSNIVVSRQLTSTYAQVCVLVSYKRLSSRRSCHTLTPLEGAEPLWIVSRSYICSRLRSPCGFCATSVVILYLCVRIQCQPQLCPTVRYGAQRNVASKQGVA